MDTMTQEAPTNGVESKKKPWSSIGREAWIKKILKAKRKNKKLRLAKKSAPKRAYKKRTYKINWEAKGPKVYSKSKVSTMIQAFVKKQFMVAMKDCLRGK